MGEVEAGVGDVGFVVESWGPGVYELPVDSSARLNTERAKAVYCEPVCTAPSPMTSLFGVTAGLCRHDRNSRVS